MTFSVPASAIAWDNQRAPAYSGPLFLNSADLPTTRLPSEDEIANAAAANTAEEQRASQAGGHEADEARLETGPQLGKRQGSADGIYPGKLISPRSYRALTHPRFDVVQATPKGLACPRTLHRRPVSNHFQSR